MRSLVAVAILSYVLAGLRVAVALTGLICMLIKSQSRGLPKSTLPAGLRLELALLSS